MTIRWKLALTLALPLVALAFVVGRGVTEERRSVADNERARELIQLALAGRDVMGRAELQHGLELSGGFPGAIRDLRDRTNEAVDAFRAVLATDVRGRFGAGFEQKIREVETAIGELEAADGTGTEGDAVGTLGRSVVALTFAGAQAIDHDGELAQRVLGYAALLEAQQTLGDLFGEIAALRDGATLSEAFRLDLARRRGALEAAATTFAATAQAGELAELESALPTEALDELFAGDAVDRDAFVSAASRGIESIDALSASVGGRLEGLAASKQDAAAADAFEFLAVGGGAAIAGLIALFLTVRFSSRMVRRLRHLSVAAKDLSEHRLPALVEGLRSGKTDVAAEESVVSVGDLGRDEIGALGRSFETVHGTVLEVAREQARILEQGISDIFVKLARRNQSLVERQITLLDQLERDEEDPDVLADLFRIDHIATRMRRNAESLLVLAGSESARKWAQPLPLAEIVQAATAEIEDYERIRTVQIDDVLVRPQVAVDLAHLLAELLENAVHFSPPGSVVEVAARRRGGACQVVVADHGLGMNDGQLEEANRLLAEPPVAGLDLSRTLGHYVVARLARRHGIDVTLDAGTLDGVVAVVSLPATLLLDRPPLPVADGQDAASEGETTAAEPPPVAVVADGPLPQRKLPRRDDAEPAAATAPALEAEEGGETVPTSAPAAAPAASFAPLAARLRPPSPQATPDPAPPAGSSTPLPRRGATVVFSAPPGAGGGVAASHRSPQERRDLISRFRRGFESGQHRSGDEPGNGNGTEEVNDE